MNIIFVASLKSYTTAVSLIIAFKKLNNNVIVLSDIKSEYIEVDDIVESNFNIKNYLINKKINPDLIFFCEGGSMKLFPQALESLKCLTAWYAIDTHMDLDKHLVISKFFDVTFLAQKEYVNNFLKNGILNTYWMPLAYDNNMSPEIKHEKIYDISYIGSNNKEMHPVRFDLIKKLKDTFPNSYFGCANGKDMYKIYAQSKIVFNKSINNDINMRYFEAMGNGAILLTDKIINNGVDDLFEKNKHYLIYDESNIITIANNYLEKHINNNQYHLEDFIKANHTYDLRVAKILETINSHKKQFYKIRDLDYANVFLMLQNYSAFLTSLRLSITKDVIKDNKIMSLLFIPLLIVFDLNIFILKLIKR